MIKDTFKLLLVGDAQTGKTSLIRRLLKDTFDESYMPTVGHEIQELEMQTRRGPVCFSVWDTAGQEKYEGLRDIYYAGSQCAIIMFDMTSASSYGRVAHWHRELLATCGRIPIVVCGNKSEAIKDRQVFKSSTVCAWELQYFDMSVKNNYRCQMPFLILFYHLIGNRFKYCALVRPHLQTIPEVEDEGKDDLDMGIDEEEASGPTSATIGGSLTQGKH